MSSYRLKCRKKKCKSQKVQIQEFQKLIMVKQWYYQNVRYVVVKNEDLLKNKKQVLSNLGPKTTLNNIPLLSDILLWMQFFSTECNYKHEL